MAHKWAEVLNHPYVPGFPKQGDKVKGGPQVGDPEGPPQKGTETKVAEKRAKKRYIIPAFSGVAKPGDTVKGSLYVGRSAMSPLGS